MFYRVANFHLMVAASGGRVVVITHIYTKAWKVSVGGQIFSKICPHPDTSFEKLHILNVLR